jgi:hypothetical protein
MRMRTLPFFERLCIGNRERTVSVRITLSGARSFDTFLSLGEDGMEGCSMAGAYLNIIIDFFTHT